MTTRLRHVPGLMTVWAICQMQSAALHAQTPPVPANNAPVTHLQLPPMPPSPVDAFRELLAKPSAERNEDLTNRPPQIRKRILAKIREYEAMNADERESRLRITQLRWYLLSFMEKSPAERAAMLTLVPEADRPLINDRLQQWDSLPREEQKEVLKYEKAMEQFAGQTLDGAAATNHVRVAVAPEAQPDALKNLDNFLNLPPGQRQQIYTSFKRFFELADGEKQKTLNVLSDTERAQVEQALRDFANLPDAKREQCLKAFGKFSQMSDAERDEFLKNAERWRDLPPAERQAWRTLVNHLTPMPPLPPGLAFPPLPPMPPMLQVNETPGQHVPRPGQ